MQILDVYTKKKYKCNSCEADVHYGKVADDKGVVYTTDGKEPNGVLGRGDNRLSAQVDIGTALLKVHSCWANRATTDIEECEAKRKDPNHQVTGHSFVQVQLSPKIAAELVEFDSLVSNAYVALYDIAGRGSPGALHFDKHNTMALG